MSYNRVSHTRDVLTPPDIDHLTEARRGQDWHPRITPYRMSLILTTLSLGTTKAVFMQQGRTIAPITLEWITGVVLASAFYFTSSYDIEGRAPRYLPWFFEFDCMDITWHFLHPHHPPVTFYRIMLNLTVILFGFSKAALSYLGSSTAVTWIDWILGTSLTTGLYVLGLYEFNSSFLWAPFFMEDRVDYVVWACITLLLLAIASFLTACIALFTFYLWAIWSEPMFYGNTGVPTYMEPVFDLAIKTSISPFFLGISAWLAYGVVWCIVLISPRAAIFLRRRLLIVIRRSIQRADFLPIHRLKSMKPFRLIFMHIILHLLGVAACAIAFTTLLGYMLMANAEIQRVQPGRFETLMIQGFGVFTMFLYLGIIGLAVILMGFMIRPFYSYPRPYPPEFYDDLLNLQQVFNVLSLS